MQAPQLLPITLLTDERGTLGVAQYPGQVPFPVARVFYTTGVPKGATRAGHAHRTLEEFLMVPRGRVHVRAEWAGGVVEAELGPVSAGFYLPPMSWIDLSDYEEGTVVIVLASGPFDEDDYIRDREKFAGLLTHVD